MRQAFSVWVLYGSKSVSASKPRVGASKWYSQDMLFEPDIIVTGEDWPSTRLIVETKLRRDRLDPAGAGLKTYMIAMQCPAGLLVFPDELWIFRDRYTVDHSIEQ